MAERRGIELLSPREVQTAARELADGGGLYLRLAQSGQASWVFRYSAPDGRRREMGLGVAHRASLALAGHSLRQAREAATAARALLRVGQDPIEHREQLRAQAAQATARRSAAQKAERTTLAVVARDYHARVIEPSRSDKHARQWIQSLESGVSTALWRTPIDAITPIALLDYMIDLQGRVPETARRVRQRLEVIFDDAEFRGLCKGNPARAIRRKLAEATKGKRERGHFAALPWGEVPAFMERIRALQGVTARALEFAVLTAARTSEVTGMTWAEVDLEARLWVVPGARMKAREPHTVYLSDAAVAILMQMMVLGSEHVFPSFHRRKRTALSNMAMLSLLRRHLDPTKRTTVHGLARAAFSSWANETGAARPDVIEAALAHNESDRTRAAYNRAQFADERRAVLAAWADYCAGVRAAHGGKVLSFQPGRGVKPKAAAA